VRGGIVGDQTVTAALGAGQSGGLDYVDELDRREQAWRRAHPGYGQVYWPSAAWQATGLYDSFRIHLTADPDRCIAVGRREGRTAFLDALDKACTDGTCGEDHSAGPDPGYGS